MLFSVSMNGVFYIRMSSIVTLFIIVVVSILFLGGCASVIYSTKNLPKNYAEIADPPLNMPKFVVTDTHIGKVYEKELTSNPDKSGAVLIENGVFALFHRIALARMAKYTIELQTYIYENDLLSRLLMKELKAAADRGVIVRILVDDNGLDSDFSDIMTLDYHKNIEVKVFNPYKYRARALRISQLAFNFLRMNYRMHNKLYIVDNSAVIIGGRNIAANYFDGNPEINFSDTEVLFIGKIAKESVNSFNKYWNYHKSIPARVFPEQDKFERLHKIEEEIELIEKNHSKEYRQYQEMIDKFIIHYNAKDYEIYWGNGALIADDPEKSEGSGEISPIITALEYLWAVSNKSVHISSAYLVPGKLGVKDMIEAKNKGMVVKVLTNSLSSTDVPPAYSAWRKYRDILAKNGVDVFEYRKEGYKVKSYSGSGASLHSKVLVFDDEITWVGSFNIDPRSALYSTEVVAAFNNKDFAIKMREYIEKDMSNDRSWKVSMEKGKIVWKTFRNGKEEVFYHSPDTTSMQRFLMFLMVALPENLM